MAFFLLGGVGVGGGEKGERGKQKHLQQLEATDNLSCCRDNEAMRGRCVGVGGVGRGDKVCRGQPGREAGGRLANVLCGGEEGHGRQNETRNKLSMYSQMT